VLRRRRRDGGDQTASDPGAVPGDLGAAAPPDAAGPAEADRYEAGQAAWEGTDQHDHSDPDGTVLGQLDGPWDISADYPAIERIDCGSLLIPVHDGFDLQINVAEEQGVWVAVMHGESGMQLQAFAAPRSGGLWDEVRQEIADNIAESGGSCQEERGPFGLELRAQVVLGQEGQLGQEPGTNLLPDPGQQLQPVRFLGYDGPRWFLRGVISGPAAGHADAGALFDAMFADIVVVRGDYPAPPRDQLEIRLPEEARQALEAQLADENEGWDLPNPFERGPEITEIR
jgi:Protein of unknown function (DUF3710)